MILPQGPLKQIHVDQMAVRRAQREKIDVLAIEIHMDGQKISARDVTIRGPSRIIQSFAKELPSGASIWIETTAEVETIE